MEYSATDYTHIVGKQSKNYYNVTLVKNSTDFLMTTEIVNQASFSKICLVLSEIPNIFIYSVLHLSNFLIVQKLWMPQCSLQKEAGSPAGTVNLLFRLYRLPQLPQQKCSTEMQWSHDRASGLHSIGK